MTNDIMTNEGSYMSNFNQHNIAGVIGSGSFGTAVANLLAINTDVLLFSRREEMVETINKEHRHPTFNVPLSERIRATSDPQEIAESCSLIFPIVTSEGFRPMMQTFSALPSPLPHHDSWHQGV